MEHKEDAFTSRDGLKMYYQYWKPENPKGIIQLVHGLAEHSSRYQNVVDKLVPEGFAIYADDHRGHGRSDGVRGYVNRFSDFYDDQSQFTDVIRAKEGDKLPVFLIGHSMGSFIGGSYVASAQDRFTGIVLSGSGVQAGEAVSPILVFLSKALSKIWPKGKINAGLSEEISRDPEVVQAYINDPMVFPHITYRLGAEILNLTKIFPQQISQIKIPILLQSGSKDTLITGVKELFTHVTAEDKTLKLYDGYYHEVYNEPEEDRKIVLDDLLKWLNEHL
jgi:alpha-beta hydrolase superfamily lysophospholipase